MLSLFAKSWVPAVLISFLVAGCDHAPSPSMDSHQRPVAMGEVTAEKGLLKNDPGQLLAVTMLPEEPRAGEELRAVVKGTGGPFSFVWTKNGERIAGENKVRLSRLTSVRGDVIGVVVASGDRKASAETVVHNSPPRVTRVAVGSSVLWRGKSFEVKPQAVDADGDPVAFRYVWRINDEELISETGSILSGTAFQRGDVVKLTVVPYDAEEEGPSFEQGLEFKVENAPPQFLSSPPETVTSRTYCYQLQVVDPDNDKVSYELIAGPNGMKIDPETGLLQWLIPTDASGAIAVRVEAQDTAGKRAFQEYVLEIDSGR